MTSKLKYTFWLLFALLLNTNSFAQEPNTPPTDISFFKANYDAVINGFAVSAYREYKPLDNGLYTLNFTASSWLANLKESAQFRWENDHIRPQQFVTKRNITGAVKQSHVDFNHDKRVITRTTKKQQEDINYAEYALDRLSFQLQLQQDLLLNKHDITYNIVHKNRFKKNQFEIIGKETLTTKAGKFDTLKIKVVREKKRRVTFIWVAPDWQYLFIKLVQLKGDKKQFSIELTDAIIGNKTVVGL